MASKFNAQVSFRDGKRIETKTAPKVSADISRATTEFAKRRMSGIHPAELNDCTAVLSMTGRYSETPTRMELVLRIVNIELRHD